MNKACFFITTNGQSVLYHKRFTGEGVDQNTQEAGTGLAVGLDKFNISDSPGRAWIRYGDFGRGVFASGEGCRQP